MSKKMLIFTHFPLTFLYARHELILMGASP